MKIILYTIVFVALALAMEAAGMAQSPGEGLRDGDEVLVTRYTYLPGGGVVRTTHIETYRNERDVLTATIFIDPRNEPIRPRSEGERLSRIEAAKDLETLGFKVDWRYLTHADLTNLALRIRTANRLKAAGIDVDWSKHKVWELQDLEQAMRAGKELESLGVKVNWREMPARKLNEMLARVKVARELEARGVTVDWEQHTLEELKAMAEKRANR